MFKKLYQYFIKILYFFKKLNFLDYHERILLNQGKILSNFNRDKKFVKLSDYEYKIFSQWGEDGIINFLIQEISINNKTFIEFGVEDFSESNCKFLLMNSDWSGFVIDSSVKNINRLKSSHYFWKYNLQALCAFIDKDNINELLRKSNFDKDLGILSIDIDGNDYHVLDSITYFDPRIIICEFNPIFGTDKKISVPYDSKFYRTKKHYSNLYWGASINAFIFLLNKREYTLVGTGMLGCNAYFVKNSLLTDHLRIMSKKPFNFNFNFRESRDVKGNLNFLTSEQRLKEIENMPVLNIESGKIDKFNKNF
jgi:hypothetical protein